MANVKLLKNNFCQIMDHKFQKLDSQTLDNCSHAHFHPNYPIEIIISNKLTNNRIKSKFQIKKERCVRTFNYLFPCFKHCSNDCSNNYIDLCGFNSCETDHHHMKNDNLINFYIISIIFSIILGSLLTMLTRFLQNSPYNWNHHQTVGLGFLLGFSPFIISNLYCIICFYSRLNIKYIIINFIVLTARGVGVIMVYGSVLAIGALTCYIFKVDYVFVDDPDDNGDDEASRYFKMTLYGLLASLILFMSVLILSVVGIVLVSVWKKFSLSCHEAYKKAINDEEISMHDIYEYTNLPISLSIICKEYL